MQIINIISDILCNDFYKSWFAPRKLLAKDYHSTNLNIDLLGLTSIYRSTFY